MNAICIIAVLLIIILLLYVCQRGANKKKSYATPQMMYWTLSFPRSGNHWLRFMLEYLSGRPTLGCSNNRKSDRPLHEKQKNASLNMFHMDQGAISSKEHMVAPFLNNVQPQDGLILIVRDPCDCIVRHLEYRDDRYSEKKVRKQCRYWLDLADTFIRFNGSKMLVDYKELIDHPERVAGELMTFCNLHSKQQQRQYAKLEQALPQLVAASKALVRVAPAKWHFEGYTDEQKVWFITLFRQEAQAYPPQVLALVPLESPCLS